MVLAILNRLFPVPIVNDYGSNVPVLIGLGALTLCLLPWHEAASATNATGKKNPIRLLPKCWG